MKAFTLKDGRRVEIARLAAGDKAALAAFNAGLSAATLHFFTPHRYDDATLDKVIARNARDEDIVFVGKFQNAIVAYFFLWYAKRRVALLGIGFADAFQGAGMGRPTMELLIETGRALGLEGIELTTDLKNDRAYALYERCGFRYLRDVDNLVGDGSIRVERAMFLPLREGAQPMTEPHAPPV